MDEDDDLPLNTLIAKKSSQAKNKPINGSDNNSSSKQSKSKPTIQESDDEKPLSSLIEKKSKLNNSGSTKSKPVKEDSDEDKPVAALIAKKSTSSSNNASSSSNSGSNTKSSKSSTKQVNDDSDSEDDMPFAEIIKKREREAEDAENPKKKKRGDGEGKTTSRQSNAKPQPRNGSVAITAEFYEESAKGQLIQTLMLRWWYAIEWPILSEIPEPPAGYESLDGFPGVFVSTRTDSLGKILDLRNSETCPSVVNLVKKPTKDLKELCILALENQMKALIEAEGENVKLLGNLKSTLATIKAINPEKADREAEKYQKSILHLAKS